MKNKYFSIAIVVSILIVALSASYYFVYFLPRYNQDSLELERQMWESEQEVKAEEENKKQQDLEACLYRVDLEIEEARIEARNDMEALGCNALDQNTNQWANCAQVAMKDWVDLKDGKSANQDKCYDRYK